MWHYVAFLDQATAELLQSLIDQGWETTVTPARVSTLKRTGSGVSEASARKELRTLVAESESDATILADRHAFLTPLTGIAGTAKDLHEPWPGMVVIADPHSADTPGKTPAADDSKTPADQPSPSPASPAPALSDRPELVSKGLGALEIPPKLWDHIKDRPKLAKSTAQDLYEARIAYSRRVGWILAPELELLDRLGGGDSPAQIKTEEILSAKIEALTQESESAKQDVELKKELVESSKQDVELKKELVESSKQDVELKKELVEQQKQVTNILVELIAQARTWRGLAGWGKWFLLGDTIFVTVVTGFLAFLLYDGKLSEWAFPAAVFVLALFAISPAVLLIIERPLKGIDEWMPGAKADEATPAQQEGQGQQAATTPGGTQPPQESPQAQQPPIAPSVSKPTTVT